MSELQKYRLASRSFSGGYGIRGIGEQTQEFFSSCRSIPPAKEVRGGFHNADLLGYGYGDPPIQGNPIFAGKALRCLFDRERELQRICGFIHSENPS
jgi:hypothetical protein